MLGLQELFDEQIKELFRPNKLGVRILENELEKIGFFITKKQRTVFESQFSNIENDTLTFEFSDDQLNKAGFSSEEELKPKLEKIIKGLSSKVDKFANGIDETMQNLVESITDAMAQSVLCTLEQRMDDMQEDQEIIYNDFAENIQLVWGVPLGLLQGLIVISDEVAQGYITKYGDTQIDNIVQELLIRIHAKANQVAKEILTLLKNGFSDGAQARWRTLHELAVVCVFISEHGEDVATRYINHEAVGTYKAAIQYNDYYIRLGATEISSEEIDSMQEEYLDLLAEYGQTYKNDYGWAAKALNLKKPTFRDIEASVELDHHRPYYKLASANVHANPSGVFNSLGLFPEEDIILAGPSNLGLIHPAQSTIISLNIITTTMLTYEANIDFIVISKAMAEYGHKVENAFITVETNISKS